MPRKSVLSLLEGYEVVVIGGKKLPLGTRCSIYCVYWAGQNLMLNLVTMAGVHYDMAHYQVAIATNKLTGVDE